MLHDARWRQEFRATRTGILAIVRGRRRRGREYRIDAIAESSPAPVIRCLFAVVADPVDLH